MDATRLLQLEAIRAGFKRSMEEAHRAQDWETEGFVWTELQRVEAEIYRERTKGDAHGA